MPNHHIVSGGLDPEKGHDAQYGYDTKAGAYEKPFVHGHATVAEASGRGGDTHRGLKSRHIQFLYVQIPYNSLQVVANAFKVPLVVLLGLVFSLDLARFWL